MRKLPSYANSKKNSDLGFVFKNQVAACTELFLNEMSEFLQATSTVILIIMLVVHLVLYFPPTFFVPDP